MIHDSLAGLLADLQHQADEKAERFAVEVVEEIQISPQTPVDTGRMKAGYRAEGNRVVTDVDYWKYVENGTREQRAQPHVAPAVSAVRARWGL